jgi:OmpA-OmpF porin, OOP family
MSIVPNRALVAAAVLVASSTAQAQRTGFDLERLTLDPSARGSLVLGTGETLPENGFRLSLAGHYERAPLVLTSSGDLRGRGLFADATRAGDVVTDRWTVHLGIGVAVTDRLELGLRLPYVVDQSGDDLSGNGLPPLRSSAFGTPSVMLRYGVLSERAGAPVSAAVAIEAHIPISRPNDLTGQPDDMIVPRVEVGKSFGSWLVAANVGANLRTGDENLTNGEELSHEALGGLVVATTGRPLRFEASARGYFNFDGLSQGLELLGGVRYALGPAELFALGGPGFLEAPGTPPWRGLVGVALGRAEAKPAAAPPPPPPPDPCAPGQAHRPEQCPALDDDGDGVPNGEDRCPLEKGISEQRGCPAVDSDGDGVADHLDKCPQVKGEAQYQGCPPPDRDGDGVLDADDKCPDQPGIPEEQGCPPKRAEIKVDSATGEGKIEIKEKVFFDTGKSTIQARSFPLLDDVAKLIAANPKIGTVAIEGHTDDRGPAELNRTLSQARADAVKDYLVKKGVDASRLDAKGFGPDRPAEPNTTAKGREANRRVEFTIPAAAK